jgi:hypothetical protein
MQSSGAQLGRPPRSWHGPRLLLGDWTPLMRDPIDVLRLTFLTGALVAASLGDWEQALRLALTFGVALVARAIDLPRPFDLFFNLGMALQAWGNAFHAFDHVYGYDKLVHFVLPAAMAALIYLVAIRLRLLPDLADESGLHQRVGIVLVAFSLGMTVGAVYEMYEYVAIHVLGAGLHVSYGDTIADLLDDAAGSLLGGALLVVWDFYGWGTKRRVPAHMIRDG